ncbi:MAG: M23 family metallopeptidase [Alphaproteobacteria bacterium]|nr:MAG: M23 family metallopeptidase [Alphaproteobacteria bacterium]
MWAVLALGLHACGSDGGHPVARTLPPPDPPPLPARKPPPPPGFVRAVAASPQRVQTVAVAPVATPAPATAPASATAATVFAYRVQAGDTVYGIARRLGVPLRSVIEANRLAPPYRLAVGQTLRIPNPRIHVVRPGDTVYGVARAYGIEMNALVRLNRISPPYLISPGDKLVLPVWSAGPLRSDVATASGRKPPPAQADRSLARGKKPKPVVRPAAGPVRAAAIPTPPPRAGTKFLWPTRGRIIARYGPAKGGLHNDGINILAPRGAPIRAAENGVVIYSGNELRGFGNLVLVKHAEGWVTAYAHADAVLVRRGQRVRRGEVIARVGSTGNVARPQLHFEIRRRARAVDPMRLLAPRGT